MKRVTWVDIMKGYAMLMVLMVHIDFVPDIYMRFISPVFLSAFFFASGYTFSTKRQFIDFAINKVRTILIPFLVFGIVNIAATQIMTFTEQEPLNIQMQKFLLQVRGDGDELWFLACIFLASFVFYFIAKYINNPYLFFLAIFALSLTSVIYTSTGGKPLPWHIQILGVACFFMGLGQMYKRYWEKNFEFLYGSIPFAIMMTLFYIGFICINYFVMDDQTIGFNSYGSNILFYYVFSFISVAFAVSITKVTPQFRAIQFIGQNTLVYFAFHGKVERVLMVFSYNLIDIEKLGDTKAMAVMMILSIVIVAATAVIMVIPSFIINNYVYFLIGRKKPEK